MINDAVRRGDVHDAGIQMPEHIGIPLIKIQFLSEDEWERSKG